MNELNEWNKKEGEENINFQWYYLFMCEINKQ